MHLQNDFLVLRFVRRDGFIPAGLRESRLKDRFRFGVREIAIELIQHRLAASERFQRTIVGE